MTLNEAIYSDKKIVEYDGNIFYLGGLDVPPEKGEKDFIEVALEFYSKKEARQNKKC